MARKRGDGSAREWRAIHRYARSGTRKVQQVVDLIRGKDVETAQRTLRTTNRKAAFLVDRVLRSAVANADSVGSADVDRLFVSRAVVGRGTIWRRWRPGPRGRTMRIRKPTCHIEVAVAERSEDA